MLGGCLGFTLMYNGLLSGLLYGSFLPFDRFGVKFRQFWLFALLLVTVEHSIYIKIIKLLVMEFN